MEFSPFEATKQWAKAKQIPLFAKNENDSTNAWAKAAFENTGNDKSVFISDFQTAGRGRFDRTWSSPEKGTALLSTWSYRLKKLPQSPFPLRLGLTLYSALEKAWPRQNWSLKAPNDIYLGSKKVCGLLVESSSLNSEHFLFIGLGLNATANPKAVEISGNLANEIDIDAISTRWVEFLGAWNAGLDHLVQSQGPLTADEQSRLLESLNRYPFLKEKYSKVSPEGDLYTASQKISWQDL